MLKFLLGLKAIVVASALGGFYGFLLGLFSAEIRLELAKLLAQTGQADALLSFFFPISSGLWLLGLQVGFTIGVLQTVIQVLSFLKFFPTYLIGSLVGAVLGLQFLGVNFAFTGLALGFLITATMELLGFLGVV